MSFQFVVKVPSLDRRCYEDTVPAEHSQRVEEVSGEGSPVEILAPAHQVLTWPNRITAADFEGWVEQRGSPIYWR